MSAHPFGDARYWNWWEIVWAWRSGRPCWEWCKTPATRGTVYPFVLPILTEPPTLPFDRHFRRTIADKDPS